VSHLISIPPGFPGPSYWHIITQSWKAVVIKHLLVLDHFSWNLLTRYCSLKMKLLREAHLHVSQDCNDTFFFFTPSNSRRKNYLLTVAKRNKTKCVLRNCFTSFTDISDH
jgi:hypothetical protein